MNEDELIAQSAEQAIRFAKIATAQLDRSNRDAADAGLQVRQHSGGDMNAGRSYAGIGGAPGDVQMRESQENRRTIAVRRTIAEAGELDMSDLLEPSLSSGTPEERQEARRLLKIQKVAAHMVNTGARRVVADAYMNPNEASMLMEQDAYRPAVVDSGWGVAKKYATLDSGKKIPVFIVEDSISGITTGKRYRLAQVAEKISRIMNVTNNPDDTRIKFIDAAYDKHVELMRSLATAKKSGNSNQVSIIESKLSEINTRLGLV